MIPRIKKITALDNFILFVEFDDGYKVMYDVKDDIETGYGNIIPLWMFGMLY